MRPDCAYRSDSVAVLVLDHGREFRKVFSSAGPLNEEKAAKERRELMMRSPTRASPEVHRLQWPGFALPRSVGQGATRGSNFSLTFF